MLRRRSWGVGVLPLRSRWCCSRWHLASPFPFRRGRALRLLPGGWHPVAIELRLVAKRAVGSAAVWTAKAREVRAFRRERGSRTRAGKHQLHLQRCHRPPAHTAPVRALGSGEGDRVAGLALTIQIVAKH